MQVSTLQFGNPDKILSLQSQSLLVQPQNERESRENTIITVVTFSKGKRRRRRRRRSVILLLTLGKMPWLTDENIPVVGFCRHVKVALFAPT
jgi:hypothetical protein